MAVARRSIVAAVEAVMVVMVMVSAIPGAPRPPADSSCDDVDKSCGDDDGGRIGPAGRSPPELVWIPLSSIVATLTLIPFIGGVIAVLEATRTSEQWTFRMVAQLAGRVLRSPLIISPLLGSLFSTAGMPLPKAASNYLDLMAATVGPAAPD